MSTEIKAVTHTEKVIAGEVNAVTHLEQVIAKYGGGGGGFTPTTAQLAAMNSGIDSEKVAQIETNETNISTVNAEILKIESGETQTETEIPISFASGRMTLSNGVITITDNAKFAYFKFAQLEYGIEYSIYIPSGIDIFAYIVNRIDNTYTRLQEFTPSWKSGEQIFKNTTSVEMQDFELVISAKKTNNTNITVEEANGVRVTYTAETEFPFVRNVKQEMGFKPYAAKGQILYNADSKSESGYIVNAVSYNDGTIIGCRSDGRVIRVDLDGTEETLLTITGSGFDWRCCYIDKNENVYVSPHATWGSMDVSDRGLYKLTKGGNSFVKVLALYDPSSSDSVLTQNNDDTIWTMCEDDNGYLYAGVYSHTVRFRPRIYKSTDGGNTWACVVDFISSGIAPSGRHIHCVIYNPWQKALYCIVGEINTIWKSTDGGSSWINLNVQLTTKGTAMLPTPNGNVIGSDGAYNCDVDFLFNDDTTHEKVYRGWANTVFGTRVSDITGFIYVFTKIDSSVNNAEYMPPYGVLYGTKTLAAWKAGEYTEGHVPTHLAEWEAYNASVAAIYPDDAIRPQHYSILISRDGGKTFSVLKAIECSSAQANGIWTVGYFENGECLCGVYHNGAVANPIVISEGKHKFVAGGCDLTGEIFVRTNTSPIVQLD